MTQTLRTLQPDADLLAAYARRRDADAFAELARRYAALVYGVSLRITRNAADAEDVTQQCFLTLARQARRVRIPLPAWLHTIAHARAIDAVRRSATRRKYEQLAATTEPAGHSPAAEAEWAEISRQIDTAIAALPEDLRQLVIRHHLQGTSQTDLASELGVSQPTLSRRLAQAVDELRGALRESGVIASTAVVAEALQHAQAAHVPASLAAELGKMSVAGIGPATSGLLTKLTIATSALIIAAGTIGIIASLRPGTGASTMSATAPTVSPRPAALSDVAFQGDIYRQDSFTLAMQAVARHFGKEIGYDELLALSGNGFAPAIRPGEPERSVWAIQGGGRNIDLVCQRLGLICRPLSRPEKLGHQIPPKPADPAAVKQWELEYFTKPSLAAVRDGMARGEVILSMGEFINAPGVTWTEWGIVTEAREDGTILGAAANGQLDNRIDFVRDGWFIAPDPAGPTLTADEAKREILRRAALRTRGDVVVKTEMYDRQIVFGAAAMDAWIGSMGRAEYCPECKANPNCALHIALPVYAGARSAAAWLADDPLPKADLQFTPAQRKMLLQWRNIFGGSEEACVEGARRNREIIELLAIEQNLGGISANAQQIREAMSRLEPAELLYWDSVQMLVSSIGSGKLINQPPSAAWEQRQARVRVTTENLKQWLANQASVGGTEVAALGQPNRAEKQQLVQLLLHKLETGELGPNRAEIERNDSLRPFTQRVDMTDPRLWSFEHNLSLLLRDIGQLRVNGQWHQPDGPMSWSDGNPADAQRVDSAETVITRWLRDNPDSDPISQTLGTPQAYPEKTWLGRCLLVYLHDHREHYRASAVIAGQRTADHKATMREAAAHFQNIAQLLQPFADPATQAGDMGNIQLGNVTYPVVRLMPGQPVASLPPGVPDGPYADHLMPYYNIHCELADEPNDALAARIRARGQTYEQYWESLPKDRLANRPFAILATTGGKLAGYIRFYPADRAILRNTKNRQDATPGTLLIGGCAFSLEAIKAGLDQELLRRVIAEARRNGYARIQAIAWPDVRAFAMWGEGIRRAVYESEGFTSLAVEPIEPAGIDAFSDICSGAHGEDVRRLAREEFPPNVPLGPFGELHLMQLGLAAPADRTGYAAIIGDLAKQQEHARTVLLPVKQELLAAADALERASAALRPPPDQTTLLTGDPYEFDSFSLTMQSVAGYFDKPAEYQTIYCLSSNAFAPCLAPAEDARDYWRLLGQEKGMDLVAASLGLQVTPLALPPEQPRPAPDATGRTWGTPAYDQWLSQRMRDCAVALRPELAKGSVILTDGGWTHDFFQWGIVLDAQEDGRITGTAISGPRPDTLDHDRHFWVASPAQVSVSQDQADRQMLAQAIARIRSQERFASDKVLYGLAAMDRWIEQMQQPAFQQDSPSDSASSARLTALPTHRGALAVVAYLTRRLPSFPAQSREHLRQVIAHYQRIADLLDPFVGTGYGPIIGKPERQQHIEQVLLPIRAELAAAADDMEKAVRNWGKD